LVFDFVFAGVAGFSRLLLARCSFRANFALAHRPELINSRRGMLTHLDSLKGAAGCQAGRGS
jgi:hypothetical protein